MRELKEKDVEQVTGGTFIPAVENNLAQEEFEKPVSLIKDDIPNVDISKYRLEQSDLKFKIKIRNKKSTLQYCHQM